MAFISLIDVLFFFIHHELCKKNEEKFHFNTFGANKLNHNCESMNAETELSETFERCGFIKAFRLMFNDQIGEKFIDFFTIIFFGSKYILFFFLTRARHTWANHTRIASTSELQAHFAKETTIIEYSETQKLKSFST